MSTDALSGPRWLDLRFPHLYIMYNSGTRQTHEENSLLLVGSNKDSLMYLLDPSTGSQLSTFKTNTSTLHGVVSIPSKEMLVSIQHNKLHLHLYTTSRDTPVFKCHLPEKMGPITTTACGTYCFAGAVSGKVYVWSIVSGALLSVWDAHYKAVSCLILTLDSSFLLSAGEDGLIHAWPLADLLVAKIAPSPYRSWTQHTLPITSLVIARGNRFISTSLDRTVRIWSVHTQEPLYSITTPSAVRVAVLDLCEHRLFIGCENAHIYVVNLHTATLTDSSVAGVVVPGHETQEVLSRPFEAHVTPVLTLAISDCGQYLISGAEDGLIHVWDSLCQKVIRTLSMVQGPVTSLQLIPPFASQLQGSEVAMSMGKKKKTQAFTPVPFKKYIGLQN